MGLTIIDLNLLFRQAMSDQDAFERIMDVFVTLADDAQFIKYSHDKYIPACHRYQEYLRGHGSGDTSLKQARKIRGQLGGYSKAMYGLQRKTFVDILTLLLPLPQLLEEAAVNALWAQFLRLERQWLSASRSNV